MPENNNPEQREEKNSEKELAVGKEGPSGNEEFLQLVIFELSREWYGVDISSVKEVVKIGKMTYLPSCPDNIVGIVNLRGNILSVTDLKKIFNMPEEELTAECRLVVVESGNLETGLIVDRVAEVFDWPVNKIEPTLTTISSEKAGYIKGECLIGDKLIGILKVEKILEKR